GNDDIVTTGSLLLGHGDGTFATPVNLVPGLNPLLVKVEDLNNDGKLAMILGTSLPELATVLINNCDGTLAPPQHYVLNDIAFAVAYFDLDGDGVSDLLFTGGSDATLIRWRGDGTFQWVQAVPTSSNLSGKSSAT